MPEPQRLDRSTMEAALRRAHMVKAPTSLRAEGSNRMLGDLQLRGIEPGTALHLVGAKRRDQIPEAGTAVTLSILLGDEVLSLRSVLLEPLVAPEGDTLFPPVLRVAWPSEGVAFHHRASVRVAAPDQAPLAATVRAGNSEVAGQIMNLTESGLGLALQPAAWIQVGTLLDVGTDLPGIGRVVFRGETRYVTSVEDGEFPLRAGMLLEGLAPEVLESVRRFIQNRRTDRSEHFRQSGG